MIILDYVNFLILKLLYIYVRACFVKKYKLKFRGKGINISQLILNI